MATSSKSSKSSSKKKSQVKVSDMKPSKDATGGKTKKAGGRTSGRLAQVREN